MAEEDRDSWRRRMRKRSAATINSPSLYSFLRLAADLLHFNMSCLGVILQVRSRDGVSTPQNGAAAYSQSHALLISQGGFPLPSMRFSSSRVSFSYGRSSLTAEAFL